MVAGHPSAYFAAQNNRGRENQFQFRPSADSFRASIAAIYPLFGAVLHD